MISQQFIDFYLPISGILWKSHEIHLYFLHWSVYWTFIHFRLGLFKSPEIPLYFCSQRSLVFSSTVTSISSDPETLPFPIVPKIHPFIHFSLSFYRPLRIFWPLIHSHPPAPPHPPSFQQWATSPPSCNPSGRRTRPSTTARWLCLTATSSRGPRHPRSQSSSLTVSRWSIFVF